MIAAICIANRNELNEIMPNRNQFKRGEMACAENNLSHGMNHKTLKVSCPTDKWL